MTTPQEIEPLSRAVSQIDLNAALKTLKDSGNTPRTTLDREKSKSDLTKYSANEIIKLRTGTENNPINHDEQAYISKPDVHGHGVVTPPYLTYPKAPPPTPATAAITSEVDVDKLSIIEEDTTKKGYWKEKKKEEKSSGIKKKKKPKSAKAPITGFEEFYADPPITPAEHEEEKWMYGEAYPFEERIQTCLQKYRARRKLDSVRGNILTKYLMLGGIESGTKAFGGGLDKQTIENSTAAEIAAIQATDYVRMNGFVSSKNYDGSDDWVVDWEGVAKGYFSYRMPLMFPIDDHDTFKNHIAVIRNFLSYVLNHAVCPEYTKEVMAAKRVCGLAEKELWTIKLLSPKMPGEFNIAASTKYGGRWKAITPEAATMWGEEDSEGISNVARGFSKDDADRIFHVGVALAGDDALFEDVSKPNGTIVKTETKSFEVISIQRSTPDLIDEFRTIKDTHGDTGTIKPLGVITFKPWKGAKTYEAEPTPDELAKMKDLPENHESFFLEDEILALCFVGLRMEVVVREMNYGFRFFDLVPGLYCSFWTELHQEKMTYWKEPLPNKRPPPTEDTIEEMEEKRLAAEAEEFAKELEM